MMLDEYTFSSIEMLRQKINVFFHAKNQPLVQHCLNISD